MTRSIRLFSYVLVMCAVLLPALQISVMANDATFTLAGFYDIPSLDYAIVDSGTAHCIIENVLEKLVRYKPGTVEIEPVLAIDWDISEDLKIYTFRLRQGIKFTDGASFNAEAVKINVERLLALKRAAFIRLKEIEEVKVLDEYTVQFILKGPSIPFLYKLAGVKSLSIVSPKAIEEHATEADPWAEDWLRDHLVGTGPYKLVEWIPEDRIILTKNEDYWKGWEGEHLDTIIRRVVPEYTTRKLLLLQGAVDMIDFPPAEDIPALRTTPGIKVVDVPTINIDHFCFNFMISRMQNKKLREALSYAFPYQEAVEIAGKGSVQLQGPMPACIEGHNDTLFVYHTDLQKAAELLEEAGYKPGELSLTLAYYTMDRNRKMFETYQINLQSIGVKLEAIEMVWGQYAPWLDGPKEKADIFLIEHWPEYPEATNFLSFLFENSEYSTSYAPQGYKDEDLNELVIEARASVDPEKRAELYEKAQEIVVNDVVSIWALQLGDAVVLRDYVKGFVVTPPNFGVHDFYLMSLEK